MSEPTDTPEPFRVTEPGFYAMTAEQYHADPCPEPSLSSSTAYALVNDAPAHAWFNHPRLNPQHQREEREQYDTGTAAHAIALEGSMQRVRIVEAPDWRTQAAKDARDALRAKGFLPLLRKTFDDVHAMTSRLRVQLDATVEGRAMFTGGRAELAAIWIERVGDQDVWCRALLDYLRVGAGIDDYKSTKGSANPSQVARNIPQGSWGMQAAFYQRGVYALTGTTLPVRFAVQECYAPYLVSIHAIGPALEAHVAEQLLEAFELWAACLTTGHWPGYTTQTTFAELPPWLEAEARRKEFSYGG